MAALAPWEFGSEDIPSPRDYAAEIDELNEELARARDPKRVATLLKKRAALAKQAIGNPHRRQNEMRAHLRRNPGPDDLPYNEWIPTHAVRFNDDGTVSLMEEAPAPPAHNRGRRRRNAKPNLVELINTYNEASDPGAYRTDAEHAVERERARTALREIRQHYIEGVDYKELSNGALWPISR